jgi:hypothetical protein
MRYAHLTLTLALTAGLSVAACNQPRQETAPAREEAVADERQQQQDEAAELEKRAADLEREWDEMQARLAKDTASATATMKAEVKEDIANAREAVADLKTTTPENWWERHERIMERNAADIEADVKRFATNWKAPEAPAEVGTTGTAEGWEARRDRLVTRLQSRIEAMENALRDVDQKGAKETELEDTRARVVKLKTDTDKLRTASEEDWWELTKERVHEYIERVDRSISRLDDNRG